MKPKGLSVTFDPCLSLQSVRMGSQNPPCWSFNGAAAKRSQNILISHTLPNKSVVARSHSQFTNMGAIENRSGAFPQKSQNNPLSPTCTRLGVPYHSIDPRYDTQILTRVPGELSQGFASLNPDSFGQNANQTSHASLISRTFQPNMNSNVQTSLNSTIAEVVRNETSQILGVPGSSLPNYNSQVCSSVTNAQPQMQKSCSKCTNPKLSSKSECWETFRWSIGNATQFGCPGTRAK